MKGWTLLGAVLLVLGLLAFVAPIPHSENYGVKIGVQTEHSERLPPAVGGGLVAAGVLVLVLGLRKSKLANRQAGAGKLHHPFRSLHFFENLLHNSSKKLRAPI